MPKRLTNYTEMRQYLQDKIDTAEGLLSNMDTERNAGQLPEFMRYNAIELAVAVFHADEARKNLATLDLEEHNGVVLTEEAKFTEVSTQATAFFLRRVQSQFTDAGRSSSISSNLAKDAVKDFYIEFYQRLNEGY
jgi:hypothetical protein